MANFTGTLNKNEIYTTLFNMIISQEIFNDRISKGEDLVDLARTNGGLYGDTKLYYAANVLKSEEWGGDSEASNLLAINRAEDPKVQAITLNKFRIIPLTLDNYLSKRAWSDEGTFAQFNSVLEGMLANTKYIYELTHYNVFLGTSADTDHTMTVNTAKYGNTVEDEVKAVANAVANVVDKMTDVSTKFNDYGQYTKFNRSDITVIWNTAWLNKFRKVDMPAIFHKEMLFDTDIKQKYLPARYWGAVVSAAETLPTEGTYRAISECTINGTHYFGGDTVPGGTAVEANTVYLSDTADSDTEIDSDYIAIILVKYPPYMSAFEEGTSFWNPRSLTTNRYLIWGENSLEFLKAYPHITLKKSGAE